MALSERHRQWGWDVPMLDIDFLVIEFDNGKVAALIEYKHESAQPAKPSHPSYRALVDLGNRAQVAVFACRYAADFSWFRAVPLNDLARRWLEVRTEMPEQDWVELLYRIRGRKMPPGLFADDPEDAPF